MSRVEIGTLIRRHACLVADSLIRSWSGPYRVYHGDLHMMWRAVATKVKTDMLLWDWGIFPMRICRFCSVTRRKWIMHGRETTWRPRRVWHTSRSVRWRPRGLSVGRRICPLSESIVQWMVVCCITSETGILHFISTIIITGQVVVSYFVTVVPIFVNRGTVAPVAQGIAVSSRLRFRLVRLIGYTSTAAKDEYLDRA